MSAATERTITRNINFERQISKPGEDSSRINVIIQQERGQRPKLSLHDEYPAQRAE